MNKKEQHLDELSYKEVGVGYRFFKRSFDIFFSLLGILVISWFLLIIIIIICCTSKGTPIFKDHRMGKDGKEIHVYKFRSMYIDAEERVKKYLTKEQYKEWKTERKIENDPRITPFGKFIRKTSIDELPQLFNILFGTMSFVGPRPITKDELNKYFNEEERKVLLSTRPGLISYWGVMGRSEIEFVDGKRQYLELAYFKLRGLWFDLKLMFRVLPSVLKHKGAM